MSTPRAKANQIPAPMWAEALRTRRIELGLSQPDLAEKTGYEVAQRTISALENGVTPLLGMSIGRVVKLAEGLGWSLLELQKATGIDLGITEVAAFPGNDATPVYLQKDLSSADAKPSLMAFFVLPPRVRVPAEYRVVVADSDEMATGRDDSIRPGDFVFVNTAVITADREGSLYAIEHQGRIHFRRLTTLPTGPAFTADNPAYAVQFIPAEQAQVVGKPFYARTDRQLQSAPRITH